MPSGETHLMKQIMRVIKYFSLKNHEMTDQWILTVLLLMFRFSFLNKRLNKISGWTANKTFNWREIAGIQIDFQGGQDALKTNNFYLM